MTQRGWRISGSLAHLETPSLEAAVDLSAPYAGLTNVSVFGNQLSGGVLGLEFQIGKSRGGLILEDAYQRGQDLVAVYAQSVERPYRATVYWRALI
jgi:hypothetical protein